METPRLTSSVVETVEALMRAMERKQLTPEQKLNVLQLAAARLAITSTGGDLDRMLEATADELAAGTRGIGERLLEQMRQSSPVAGTA